MLVDRSRVEAALAPLVGLPLWKSTRGADMQAFQLGAMRTEVIERGPRAGESITVGSHALHIQCAWRITGPAGILVGHRDLYVVAGADPTAELPGWSWDEPGANRRDQQIAEWLRGTTYMIESAGADRLGGFTLGLSGGWSLDVFPDDSLDQEFWRLLRPCTDEPHFVVTGAGIEE